MTYIALNQAALINMVERVDWKDTINGGSTLGQRGGAQAPKFSRTLDTLWSTDSQKLVNLMPPDVRF